LAQGLRRVVRGWGVVVGAILTFHVGENACPGDTDESA